MSWASDEFPQIRARLMAAAMQPIERLAAEATIEILELNSWLDDELKCEVKHASNQACTVVVTHRQVWCTGSGPICASAAAWIQAQIDAGLSSCGICKSPISDHWRVVPV